jgi:hypothetical protein
MLRLSCSSRLFVAMWWSNFWKDLVLLLFPRYVINAFRSIMCNVVDLVGVDAAMLTDVSSSEVARGEMGNRERSSSLLDRIRSILIDKLLEIAPKVLVDKG